nr:MFS transporter [Actinomadura rayongensis]
MVIAAFTIVMAGPNLPTPLFPYYRTALGLSAFGLTALVGVYLVALVAVLLSAVWFARRFSPRALVAGGLVLAAAGDAFLAVPPSVAALAAGRVLHGVAVGVATGAVAVLLREHGTLRNGSLPALCALLGSAAGTAFTAVLAQYLPWPRTLAYVAHAVLALACAAALSAVRALGEPRRADAGRSAGGAVVRPGELARFWSACAAGVAAWVTAGLVVALVPSYAVLLLHATNLVVVASPVVVFLVAACFGSVAAGRRPPRTEFTVAPALMAAGLALTALSGPWRSTAVLVVGALLTGAGQGLAFRGGFAVALTLSAPARHGVAASRYNAGAYLGAAVTALGMGLLVGRIGLDDAFRWAAVLFAAGAVLLAVVARRLFPGPAGGTAPEPAG